jgi:hypothetical protein
MEYGAFAFTSNVDGQFQKAGFPPEHVAECRGTIHALQCMAPCINAAWTASGRSLGAQRCDWREYAWPDIFRNSNAAFVRRSCGRDVCFHLLGFRHRHSGGSRVRGYTWKTILSRERG